MDDFSVSDFEAAASATASPEETGSESPSADDVDLVAAPEGDGDVDGEADPEIEAPVAPAPTGPIPLEVHRKSLENARVKGGEEALTRWRQQYGWAEQIPQPDLQRWGATADRLLSDPVQYAEDLEAELLEHPTYGPQMRQRLARRQQTRTEQQQASQPPEPDVQIVDEHGRVVGMTYSDQALARRDAVRERQLKLELQAEWSKQLAPLDKMRSEAEERERYFQINTKVDQQLAEAAKWPHFAAHQTAIGVEVTKGADLRDAYLTVLSRDIYPGLAARERQTVLGSLRTKIAATTASPGGGGGRAPLPDSEKSFEQIFAEKAGQFGV